MLKMQAKRSFGFNRCKGFGCRRGFFVGFAGGVDAASTAGLPPND
jgi:hypothetical protein